MTSKDPRPENLEKSILHAIMQCAAEKGWAGATLIDAAHAAGKAASDVHRRFPNKNRILIYLGQQADQLALAGQLDGTPREKVFELFMRRLDTFQEHREGVRAVMRAMPFDPLLSLMLSTMTMSSMEWLGSAAGLDLSGIGGKLRVRGLLSLWVLLMRSWDQDDSEDLAHTMSSLDRALDRAERFGLLKVDATHQHEADGPHGKENLASRMK